MTKKLHNHSDILNYLSDKDKSIFLNDLLQAVEQSKNEGNFYAVNACMEEWEDTVELLSIPGLRDNVWSNFKELKDSGLIN